MQQKLAASAALTSLFAAIPFVYWGVAPMGHPPAPKHAEGPAEAGSPLPSPILAGLTLPPVLVTLAKGDTLAGKLLAGGLAEGEARELVAVLAEVRDPRRLALGTTIALSFALDGCLEACELSHGANVLARVVREDDRFVPAVVAEAPTKTELAGIVGAVSGSLWESVTGLGEGPELAVSLARLFARDVDPVRDLKSGDRFTLVVEKRWREQTFLGYGRILAASLEADGLERMAILFSTSEGASGYFSADGEGFALSGGAGLRPPLPDLRVTSRFSAARLHPILGRHRPHLGVDFAAPRGTPVVAAAAGRVTFAGWSGGFGRSVTIRHGGGLVTQYGHLSSIAAGLSPGDSVAQGQAIGRVGSTGLATGPHLDFRIQRGGRFVDPVAVLRGATAPASLSGDDRRRFEEVKNRILPPLRDMLPGTKRPLDAAPPLAS